MWLIKEGFAITIWYLKTSELKKKWQIQYKKAVVDHVQDDTNQSRSICERQAWYLGILKSIKTSETW
jgi:hypothetical protein